MFGLKLHRLTADGARANRLDRILRSERRMRPDNLLVIGASNNGKTAIAWRFHARHILPEDAAAERATIPVAFVQAPNGPLGRLASAAP